MLTKLVLLFIAITQLTDGAHDECSSQNVADSVERRLHSTLVNLTRNQAQVDELLAPVSSFLQAALLKQVLAEYGVNPTNTTTKSDPQLNQIREAIVRIDNTLNQILRKLNMTSTDTNGYSPPSLLLSSCEEIKAQFSNSPSGYYTIIDGTGHARHVYCQMEQVCGSSSGWTRMAYLNMSDPTEECPSGFRLYSQNGVRACGRPVTSGGSCQSLHFSSYSISYSQVCGRVYGYQKGNPDGFWRDNNQVNINNNYVDGISITRGSLRKHVWSYVAGVQENSISGNGNYDCPCSTGSIQQRPPAVGNDYFCESGNSGLSNPNTFFNDRLWDGEQCGAIERRCCNAPGLPWFHKTLSSPTSDYIELRLCCNEGTSNEDVPMGFYEIYTK